ncbi:STAS domain-containing protein [Pseudomonas sp. Marseille-QA0892]
MSEASIKPGDAPGLLLLEGVLDHRSGPPLRENGQRLILGAATSEIVINCAAVRRSTSVGLALLLAFMRDAKAAGKTLRLHDLPRDMRQIAQVCSVAEFLPTEA